MCENIEKCCRICLDTESNHVSALEDHIVHLHIRSCLGLTVSNSDELPKMVCVSCVSLLSDFYNFQLNARCSQDWLESAIQEKSKKCETKVTIQPLPDSEYNSDSLLEFLNNTANIEEYLNNLGKEDIPCIVNMLDKNNENSFEEASKVSKKVPSPKKKIQHSSVKVKPNHSKMEIDVLDSEIDIVKEILMKEIEPTKPQIKLACFACKCKCENINSLSQHLSTCDLASRTCMQCHALFDSKQKMQQHSSIHNQPLSCNCGKQFSTKENLSEHHKSCYFDYTGTLGCIYRCKQCNATFKERFLLYKHAKEHILKADERICDICGHGFIGNEALTKHRKEDHQVPEDLMYRCKICGESSKDRKEIYVHVQKHTATAEKPLHLCETCGKSFSTRATLLRHTAQHRAQCDICKMTFSCAKLRDQHAIGHGEAVMCEKCGQNIAPSKLDQHCCL